MPQEPTARAGDDWAAIDRYLEDLFVPEDAALSAALAASEAAGLPPHQVSPSHGKFLQLLATAIGARAILEIGTLGGYSTIWLARALPDGGRLVTLELEPAHVEVARSNLERAGLTRMVEIVAGRALDSLDRLIEEGCRPFDLVFIDADKPSNADYLERVLRLSRPATVIVADNVVREGAVARPGTGDASVDGIRRFNEMLAADPRLSATTIQTVGAKGHDGFAIALVLQP